MMAIRSIVLICGYPASGKTTGAKHLASVLNWPHFEASDAMRSLHAMESPYENIDAYATRKLRADPSAVPRKIRETVANSGWTNLIVSGPRSLAEVTMLLDSAHNAALLFVEASVETRYLRAVARNRDDIPCSIESFVQRDESQRLMGLDQIANFSLAAKLANMATIEEYDSRLLEAARGLQLGDGIRLTENASAVVSRRPQSIA